MSYVTGFGTATHEVDYTSTHGTLNFADGETSKTVAIPIINDDSDEADETIEVSLNTPGGGAGLGAQTSAVVTVIDDDLPPAIASSDMTVSEPRAGSDDVRVLVSLSAPSAKTITIDYVTIAGTATSGADYQARSGTLTFQRGANVMAITIPFNHDESSDADETFTVRLSNPTHATPAYAEATVTITDTPPMRLVFLPLVPP